MKTDERLQRAVMDELRREPLLHPCEIDGAVNDKVVARPGQVDTPSPKITGKRATKQVPGAGVRDREGLVKPRFGHEYTGEQTGHAVVGSFGRHGKIPQDALTANVQQGWITLAGGVDWDYQRQAALKAVESVDGVKGVMNLIQVKTGQGVSL